MLNEIMNQEELDFLRTLGIDERNGKLYNVATGEDFVQSKDDVRWTDFIFKCGDIEVTLIFHSRPISVRVKKDGLKYRYCPCYNKNRGLYEGIELEIYKEEEEKTNSYITIFPEYDKYFLKTIIRPSKYGFNVGLNYGFSRMLAWEEGCYEKYGYNASKEIYQECVEAFINNVFDDEEIRDAYLSCMPIIMQRFESMLDFPVRNYEEFERYFERKIDGANESLSNRVDEMHQRILYRQKEFREEHSNKEPGSIVFEQTKEYFEQLQEFYTKTVQHLIERNDKIEKITEDKKEFKKYIEEINEKKKNSSSK